MLLDGLDEVPTTGTRREQIKTAVEEFASVFPRCRIVVTGRTFAYQRPDWRLTGFEPVVLAPFGTGQIRRFIDRRREAALLAGAKSARGSGFALSALAEALCWTDPPKSGEPQEEADAWGALLAGQALSERGDLSNVNDQNRGKLDRVKGHLVRLIEGGTLPAVERCAAGDVLGRIGDPRPGVVTVDAMQLCLVPAGPFRMGSGKEDKDAYDAERPQHTLEIPYEYRLARYPVTVEQFTAFVEARGHEPGDRDCLKGLPNHPVVLVDWHEARAFCAWLTTRWREAGQITEGCFPGGVSPYGCLDMAGNVLEWTSSIDKKYPYDPADGREKVDDKGAYRVSRGGGWGFSAWSCRSGATSAERPSGGPPAPAGGKFRSHERRSERKADVKRGPR